MRRGARARGIVAEPPKRGRSRREGDGADSPTRATKKSHAAPKVRSVAFFVSEAARPNIYVVSNWAKITYITQSAWY